MAQLVAHLVRDQEVACSSQVTQTEKPQDSTCGFFLSGRARFRPFSCPPAETRTALHESCKGLFVLICFVLLRVIRIFRPKCDFMKKEVFLLCVCLLISSCAVPTVVVRGTVYDDNDEPLPSCTVYTSRRNKVVNDSFGNYSIAVPNKGRTFIHFFPSDTKIQCCCSSPIEAMIVSM